MGRQHSWRRVAFILATILPAIFAALFMLSWILGIPIKGEILIGLGIEAVGAVMTAFVVAFLDLAYGHFIDQEFKKEDREVATELYEIRQELNEIRLLIGTQYQRDTTASTSSRETE